MGKHYSENEVLALKGKIYNEHELELNNIKAEIIKLQGEISLKNVEIELLGKQLASKNISFRNIEIADKHSLIEENERLRATIKKMEFEKNNNEEVINIRTEKLTLAAELNIAKSETQYLKKLLETYQEIPNIKKMIENLSSLSVPGINELKEFGEMIQANGIGNLNKNIEIFTKGMREIMSEFRSRGGHFR